MSNNFEYFESIALIEGLKEIKEEQNLTIEKISQELNVNKSTISRYLNQQILPTSKHKEKIIIWLENKGLEASVIVNRYVTQMLTASGKKVLSLTKLMNQPKKLFLISYLFIKKNPWVQDTDIVITVETEGIPFATIFGLLLGKTVAYFRKQRSVTWPDFIRIDLERAEVAVTEPLFLNREIVQGKNKALILDDIVRSGETISKLHEGLTREGIQTLGVIILTSLTKKIPFSKPKPIHGFNPILTVEF